MDTGKHASVRQAHGPTSRQEWRTACRQVARQRALEEARRAWHLDGEQPVPFNHRWEHVQEVVGLALRLAAATQADADTVEAAAWLHDICKLEAEHSVAGAREAEAILRQTDFPAEKIPSVVAAIRQHEGLFRPAGAPPLQPLEAAILWDADKLSKLGVHALAFQLSTHHAAGKSLVERRLDVERFAQTVLQRTVASMNTEPGRQMAERRYQAMMAALAAWAAEEAEAAPVARQ
ncbi:MAG: hypothetical protein KatS3mg050_4844 [Litorilinea sp.]|nr:MAG: hypothetical protein KatS3mg050_4844 [Litorilinea sp.]